jgi:hypothetical protein
MARRTDESTQAWLERLMEEGANDAKINAVTAILNNERGNHPVNSTWLL